MNSNIKKILEKEWITNLEELREFLEVWKLEDIDWLWQMSVDAIKSTLIKLKQ